MARAKPGFPARTDAQGRPQLIHRADRQERKPGEEFQILFRDAVANYPSPLFLHLLPNAEPGLDFLLARVKWRLRI